MSGLQRFLDAQARTSSGYKDALAEIRKGRKTTHWIWYIFPQITGLSHKPSDNTLFYAIQSFQEAKAYLKHSLLRQRLLEITQAAHTALVNGKTILALLSSQIDVTKFQASMTLFLLAAYENGDVEAYQCFKTVLEKAYSGGALHLATMDEIESDLPMALRTYQSATEMPANMLSVDRSEPQPVPTFPILKHSPTILIADQSPCNQQDRALSTALDQAFQFSRTERFFQWLYNLTHAKKNRFHSAQYKQALLANLDTPSPVQSFGWVWLMGLSKLSKKITQISCNQARNTQVMPQPHFNDGGVDEKASEKHSPLDSPQVVTTDTKDFDSSFGRKKV